MARHTVVLQATPFSALKAFANSATGMELHLCIGEVQVSLAQFITTPSAIVLREPCFLDLNELLHDARPRPDADLTLVDRCRGKTCSCQALKPNDHARPQPIERVAAQDSIFSFFGVEILSKKKAVKFVGRKWFKLKDFWGSNRVFGTGLPFF